MALRRKLVSSGLVLLSFVLLYVSWNIYGKEVDTSTRTHKITGIYCDRCNERFSDVPEKCASCSKKTGTVNVTFDRCRNCGSRFSKDNYCTTCGERLIVNVKKDELSELRDSYDKNMDGIQEGTRMAGTVFALSCLSAVGAVICARKRKLKRKAQH